MANHCIICFKEVSIPDPTKQIEKDSSSKLREKCERFFKLLERYLKEPGDECFQPFPVWEKIFDVEIPISCGTCQKVMESFCELFHQMKSIELLINWKLWTLKNIMYSAERVPSRVNDFKEAFIQMKGGDGSSGGLEQLNLILNFKHALIRKCRRKLVTACPRLKLVKLQVKIEEPVQAPTPVYDDCTNDVTDMNITCNSSSTTLLTHVTGSNHIPSNNSSLNLEVDETSVTDQDIEEQVEVVASAHLESTTSLDPAPVDDCVKATDIGTTSNSSIIVPIQVTGNNTIPMGHADPMTLEVDDASAMDQDDEEQVLANALHIQSTSFSSIPEPSEGISSRKNKSRLETSALLKNIRKRALARCNSESDFSCSDDEDEVEDNSESDDSESEYYNDDDINVEEGFKEEERGNNLELTGSEVKKCAQTGCGANFPNYLQLRKHERIIHGIEKQFTCAHCNVTFKDRAQLRDHIHQKHKDELNNICTFENCDKRYKTNELLEDHVKAIHEEKKGETCHISKLTPACDTGCSSVPSSSSSIAEEDLHQETIVTSQNIKTETTLNNSTNPEITNFEKVHSCSEVTPANTPELPTETGTELEELPTVIEVQNTEESSTSRLRTVHRCDKCKKTFSSLERLSEHQQTHKKENYSNSKSDEDRSFETENSESDFSCSDDEDEVEDHSESDDSESEYYNDDDINAEEDFNQEERGKDLEPKSPQSTSTLRPKLATAIADDHQQFAVKTECPSSDKGSEHALPNPITKDGLACNICKWSFNHRNNMKRHYNTFHNPQNLIGSHVKKCRRTGCPAYFLTTFQLQRHEKQVHVRKHMKSHSSGRKARISISKRGRRRQRVAKIESSSDDKGFKKGSNLFKLDGQTCSICKLTLCSRTGMKQHYDIQHNLEKSTGSDVKKCVETGCGAYFLTSMQLQTHEKMMHAIYKRKEYKCFDCNIIYSSAPGLRKHYLHKHAHELTFVCTVEDCGSRFKTNELLERHTKHIHEQCKFQLIKCPTCEKQFWGEGSLKNHLKSHSSAREAGNSEPGQQQLFHCNVTNCDTQFSNRENYDNHQKLHGRFTCFFCDVTKDYALELARHEIKEHSAVGGKVRCSNRKRFKSRPRPTIFTCPRPNCSLRCNREETYIQHFVSEHMGLNALANKICTVCNLTLSHSAGLKYHYDTHHNLKISIGSDVKKCEQTGCPAYFLTSEQLRTHERNAHGIDKRPTTCIDCNKTFTSTSKLNEHCNRMHKHELHYVCSFEKCDRRFKTNELLQGHIKAIHDQNLQLLKCPTCEKQIWGEYNFNRHLKSHSQVPRKYVCEQCGNAFKERDKLETHYLSHSGPASWKFECSACSKKCLTQQKLDEHMRTHTKEKPFVCEICGVKYAHRHNLRIHVNNKHGDVIQDKPRKFKKVNNLSSKKGMKRKKAEEESFSESSFGSESDE